MTTEIKELLEDNIPKEMIDRHGGTFEKLMRLYALQVAERAVGEEREQSKFMQSNMAVHNDQVCNHILTRIKKETEQC